MSAEAASITTVRCLVNAWQCDIMGHMNTRHIEALFDEATGWLISRASGGRNSPEEGLGWADRKHGFEFLREIRAGDPVEVRSTVCRIGSTSVTTRHELVHSARGEALATAEIVTVCFDTRARVARPIPEAITVRLLEPHP